MTQQVSPPTTPQSTFTALDLALAYIASRDDLPMPSADAIAKHGGELAYAYANKDGWFFENLVRGLATPAPDTQTPECHACDGRGGYDAGRIIRGPGGTEEWASGGTAWETCPVCVPADTDFPVTVADCPDCGRCASLIDGRCNWAAVGMCRPAERDPLPDDWQAFRGLTVRDKNGDAMVWRENGIRTGYYPVGTVAA